MKQTIKKLLLRKLGFLLTKLMIALALCSNVVALAQDSPKTSFGSSFVITQTHLLTAYQVVSGKDE